MALLGDQLLQGLEPLQLGLGEEARLEVGPGGSPGLGAGRWGTSWPPPS